MNNQLLRDLIILCLAFTLTGCAGVEVYSSNPEVQRVSNDYFTAEIRPQLKEGRAASPCQPLARQFPSPA